MVSGTKGTVASKQRYLGVAAIALGIIPIAAFFAANLVNHFMTAPSPHREVYYVINAGGVLAIVGGLVLVSMAAYTKIVAPLLVLIGLIGVIVIPSINLVVPGMNMVDHFMKTPNHLPVFYTVIVTNLLLIVTGIVALKSK